MTPDAPLTMLVLAILAAIFLLAAAIGLVAWIIERVLTPAEADDHREYGHGSPWWLLAGWGAALAAILTTAAATAGHLILRAAP